MWYNVDMKREQGIFGARDYRAIKRFLRRNGYGENTEVMRSRNRSRFTRWQKAALSRMIKNYAQKINVPFERNKKTIRVGNVDGVVHNGVIDEIVFSGNRTQCLEYVDSIRRIDRDALYKITLDNPSYYPLINDGIGYIKPNNAKTLRNFVRGMMKKYKNNSALNYERTNHRKGQETIFYVVKTTRV